MCCGSREAPCDDCGIDTIEISEWYMVVNEIWPPGAKYLCIGCLETRLGRKLQLLDFDIALGNIEWKQSDRFRDRLDQKLFESLFNDRINKNIARMIRHNRKLGYGCTR